MIKFIHTIPEDNISIQHEIGNDVCIPDLLIYFQQFMLGMGYQLKGDIIVDEDDFYHKHELEHHKNLLQAQNRYLKAKLKKAKKKLKKRRRK